MLFLLMIAPPGVLCPYDAAVCMANTSKPDTDLAKYGLFFSPDIHQMHSSAKPSISSPFYTFHFFM